MLGIHVSTFHVLLHRLWRETLWVCFCVAKYVLKCCIFLHGKSVRRMAGGCKSIICFDPSYIKGNLWGGRKQPRLTLRTFLIVSLSCGNDLPLKHSLRNCPSHRVLWNESVAGDLQRFLFDIKTSSSLICALDVIKDKLCSLCNIQKLLFY